MRPFKGLISDEEAFNIIMENIQAIDESEELSIELVDRRILAEDVKAPYDVPPFRRSAMDGYAVRSKDTLTGKPFRVVGEIFAGMSKEIKINENECIKIATGAPLPDSCDAVVMVENTEAVEGEKDMVRISKPVQPFENVSKVGEDIKKGETVLEKHTLLDPSKIGALAALGMKSVNVLRKPRIAIVSTGNELVPLGKELEKGKVYNINTYTLSSLVERNFCKPVAYDIVEDREEELKRALNSAIDNDMIVFSGGSSVGEKDMLVDILGKDVLFHGVKIKPGKPTMFALYKDKPVLCLPGFPTSCLMNGYLFLVPAVRKMAGAPERERRIVRAKMAQTIKLSRGRKKNVTVRLEGEYAYSVYKESSTITSLARATGFITVDADKDLVEKGEEVEVELFSW